MLTYETTEATFPTDAGTETHTVYAASDMTYGYQRNTFRKWARCSVCGLNFPESGVTKYQGKTYGISCGCYKDINQLRRRR